MRRLLIILGASSLALVGCGGAGDPFPREPVSGVVTLDGKPVPAGMITFTPIGGAEPVASGVIRDGHFELPRADGPAPGSHRVTIWSRGPTGRKVVDADNPKQLIDEFGDLIPARYSFQSDLTAEVRAAAENAFDFRLSGLKAAAGQRGPVSRR